MEGMGVEELAGEELAGEKRRFKGTEVGRPEGMAPEEGVPEGMPEGASP